MFHTDEIIEQQKKEAHEELMRIKHAKDKSSYEKIDEIYESYKQYDYTSDIYEQFDELTFENKKKVDRMYYNILLRNLPINMLNEMEKTLESLYKTIGEIYEFINVKPEIYGNNITFEVINESNYSSFEKLSKNIDVYFRNNYYNLTTEEKENKFFDTHKDYAKQLISESKLPVEDSIKMSVTTRIVEGLLKNISFPFLSATRLKYLMEDYDYGEIFDQGHLVELVNIYENKIFNLSKVVSVSFMNK